MLCPYYIELPSRMESNLDVDGWLNDSRTVDLIKDCLSAGFRKLDVTCRKARSRFIIIAKLYFTVWWGEFVFYASRVDPCDLFSKPAYSKFSIYSFAGRARYPIKQGIIVVNISMSSNSMQPRGGVHFLRSLLLRGIWKLMIGSNLRQAPPWAGRINGLLVSPFCWEKHSLPMMPAARWNRLFGWYWFAIRDNYSRCW